jgi:hypothetical protein
MSRVDPDRDDAPSYQELTAVAEDRAERVVRHAEDARPEAEKTAAVDARAQELRVAEANAHQQSAELLKQTAALYRTRARDLSANPRTTAPIAPESFAAKRAELAAQRERIAAKREQLTLDLERTRSTLQWAIGERERLASKRALP